MHVSIVRHENQGNERQCRQTTVLDSISPNRNVAILCVLDRKELKIGFGKPNWMHREGNNQVRPPSFSFPEKKTAKRARIRREGNKCSSNLHESVARFANALQLVATRNERRFGAETELKCTNSDYMDVHICWARLFETQARSSSSRSLFQQGRSFNLSFSSSLAVRRVLSLLSWRCLVSAFLTCTFARPNDVPWFGSR